MTYITTEQFNQLRKQVMDLSTQVSSLQSQVLCKTGLYTASHDAYYYSEDYDGTRTIIIDNTDLVMLLNDKLPINKCYGSIGVMWLKDAIVYAHYMSVYDPADINSGWQVARVAYGFDVG